MRRLVLAAAGLVAFAGILAAAFLGGPPMPAKPPAAAPGTAKSGAMPEAPPKPPEEMLGIEPQPGPEGERHGARMSPGNKLDLGQALALFAEDVRNLKGRPRTAALAAREMELLWGSKKAVKSLAPEFPWIVAVEEGADPALPTAENFAAMLRDFDAAFRARFKSLFDATPPPDDWVAPVVVLRTRDDYLRKTRPPILGVSHVDLPSGWSYVPASVSNLEERLRANAVGQLWIGLALGRGPNEGIPTAGLAAWFWQGTAGCFASDLCGADGRFTPDPASSWRNDGIHLARDGKLRPVPALLGLMRRDIDQLAPLEALSAATQSVMFVDFLETPGGKRSASLEAYAGRELAGKGGLEAAKECFGDLDALDAEFKAYVRLSMRKDDK